RRRRVRARAAHPNRCAGAGGGDAGAARGRSKSGRRIADQNRGLRAGRAGDLRIGIVRWERADGLEGLRRAQGLKIQPQIVLCVPGRWKSRVDLNVALLKKGYLLLGERIAANDASASYAFELQEHDPRMGRAFATAASRVDRSLTMRDCFAIDKH